MANLTKGELELIEYLELQLRKTENILSNLGKKKVVLLSKEDGDQWVTLSFRKRWFISQIDSLTNKTK